jgi:hypothetical protein
MMNEKQQNAYNYLTSAESLGRIALIQAGPGTGKTFTMLQVAKTFLERRRPVHVIIYKHDLLLPFQDLAKQMDATSLLHSYTVASLFMKMFDVAYYKYIGIEAGLTCAYSDVEFFIIVTRLLYAAELPIAILHPDSLVIIDEYTVIPKTLLFILLCCLKYNGIRTVVCGDRNQLQDIQVGKHTSCITSFEIVRPLADALFYLKINERCVDESYAEFIDTISILVDDSRLDDTAYLLLSYAFASSILRPSSSSLLSPFVEHVHMAATHQELTDSLHDAVCLAEIPVSFYYIDPTNVKNTSDSKINGTMLPGGLFLPSETSQYLKNMRPGRFLPYLPLIVGGCYYMSDRSENGLCVLTKIERHDAEMAIEVVGKRDAITRRLVRKKCNSVVFDKHKNFLLGKSGGGSLYNYPIYPAFSISLHMCQGKTINSAVHLTFGKMTTYRGMYVGLSRVKTAKRIIRMTIPKPELYVASALVSSFGPSMLRGLRDQTIPSAVEIFDKPVYVYAYPAGYADRATLVKAVSAAVQDPTDETRLNHVREILFSFPRVLLHTKKPSVITSSKWDKRCIFAILVDHATDLKQAALATRDTNFCMKNLLSMKNFVSNVISHVSFTTIDNSLTRFLDLGAYRDRWNA